MVRTIRTIHGIHSPEGNNNMGVFAEVLASVYPRAKVLPFEYGFMGFWAARWNNDEVAMRLAEVHRAGRPRKGPEVWITHSNGAAVAWLATKRLGCQPDMIVNFNPALDRWRTAPVRRVETIHSEQDRWVDLSQWLPFHLWGDQGKVGYRGKEQNTTNINASRIGGAMAYSGHTGFLERSRIKSWAHFVVNRVEMAFGGEVV